METSRTAEGPANQEEKLMNTPFSIDSFAAGCKQTMAAADNGREAARSYLEDAIDRHGVEAIIGSLQAAVPSDASIGELIVHASPELTMLYARVPGRFQSGIHNHTVCAVIGQLRGSEINRIYEPDGDGALREARTLTVRAGEILTLTKDVIHCIENPNDEPAHALHLYAGDFGAISDRRSLWSWVDHQQKPFSFPELLKESAVAMHQSANRTGLDALVQAMPASRALVDSLTKYGGAHGSMRTVKRSK
jgi:predicted metal-dependent enzyme (double-stranded beta helix superfamily)